MGRKSLIFLTLAMGLFCTLAEVVVAAEPQPIAPDTFFYLDEKLSDKVSTRTTLLAGRPDAAWVRNPDGSIDGFVEDEVLLQAESEAELREFLKRYKGEVIDKGSLPPPPKSIAGERIRSVQPLPLYLIRVNLERFRPRESRPRSKDTRSQHRFAFSTREGMHLIRLVLESREADFKVSPNFLMDQQSREHPNGAGGFLDPDEFCSGSESTIIYHAQWRKEYCSLAGRTIRVREAREYVRMLGGPEDDVFIAFVDGGFTVDANGHRAWGNLDHPHQSPTYNFETDSYDVGGAGCRSRSELEEVRGTEVTEEDYAQLVNAERGACWHGTASALVATAIRDNEYGTVGTGAAARHGPPSRGDPFAKTMMFADGPGRLIPVGPSD